VTLMLTELKAFTSLLVAKLSPAVGWTQAMVD
jgi:hypothetical protein